MEVIQGLCVLLAILAVCALFIASLTMVGVLGPVLLVAFLVTGVWYLWNRDIIDLTPEWRSDVPEVRHAKTQNKYLLLAMLIEAGLAVFLGSAMGPMWQ